MIFFTGTKMIKKYDSIYHSPVMVEEILQNLITQEDGQYIDCTLGGGGHSEAILENTTPQARLFSFDRDNEAIAFAKKRLDSYKNFTPIHARFSELSTHLTPNSYHGILYDLGVSSHQLDASERGFSFRENHSVDLRMNNQEGLDATEFIKQTDLHELSLSLKINSDLQKSKILATKLKELIAEKESPVSTFQIKELVKTTFPNQPHKINSLTAQVLQAIRMEVNQELKEIEDSLDALPEILIKGARVCILSYHSVEDRMVKRKFQQWELDCLCPKEVPVCVCGGNNRKFKKVHRKPLPPTPAEIAENGRARSAKLRVYEKV